THGVDQGLAARRAQLGRFKVIDPILDEGWCGQVDTQTIGRSNGTLDGNPRAVELGRAVGARVFVAISGQSIGGWIADRAAIDGFGEHDAEAAREGVDRPHLEWRLPGEVDAEQSTAVGLGHPAWLGDPADVEVAPRVKCEAHGAEESLAPEREARP